MSALRRGARSASLSLGVLTALIAAVGCGGGGGGGGDGSTTTTSSGVVSGPITGFGSIFVAGVEIEFGDDSRINDGRNGQDDFRLGQIVEVEAVFAADGRTAQAVAAYFDANVEGPVGTVVANGFTVLGRTVVVDEQTVFERTTLAGMRPGDIVEVYGVEDAGGSIRATRVEGKPAFVPGGDDFIEVEGVVDALGPTTFRIGTQLVDYSGAALDDLPADGLSVGLRVEVKTNRALEDRGGELVLIATRVEGRNDDPMSPPVGGRLEVEGFVTSIDGDRSGDFTFSIGTRQVRVVSTTLFENGGRGDLALNGKVEAEGTVGSDGALVAKKVSLRRANSVRVTATVDAKSGDVATLLGIPVRIGSSALIRDDNGDSIGNFDIEVGNWIEVRGFLRADGVVEANRVERDDPEDRVELRGPADTSAGLSILGVTIVLGAGTRYEDVGDAPISQARFFELLATGSFTVEAKGVFDGASILAEEVSLEIP